MKSIHVRSCPVRQLSESLSVKYIGPCHEEAISRLVTLLGGLQEKEDGEYLALNEISPNKGMNSFNARKELACLYLLCF